jgi:hypothetical protein
VSARAKAMLLALALLGMGLSAAARAELVQKGSLRIATSAKISPHALPRGKSAPVAVSLASKLTTTDGSVPPALKELRIELNRHGRLDTTGLPECRAEQIQPASTQRALSACRASLLGRGSFSVDVVLGSQEPYPTKGRLLLFNGRYKGHSALLGQVYAARPFASSFLIPFAISHLRHGSYGIALTAALPKAFTSWGHITALSLRLARRYSYRGERHSFISAGCPAPDGFSGALFALARTRLAFAGGKRIGQTLTGGCRVG